LATAKRRSACCCSQLFLQRQSFEEKASQRRVAQPLGGVCIDTLKNVESLMRLREPAAWVALGALVLNLVLVLVGLATFEGPLVSTGWMWSERVANPMSLLALAVLVGSCLLRERTPHARQLTLVSVIVSVIAVLLGLTLALLGIGATAPILAVLAAIVPQTISIIAVGLLINLLRLQAVPRRLPPGIGLVVPEQLSSDFDQERADPSHSVPAPSAHGQRLQPTTADWGETPTVRWQHIATPTNGSSGWIPGDRAIQPTVPMPEQQPPGQPEDPPADQGQWNLQPLALDWSGSPKS
jgi:hypothetical protein